MKQRGAAVVIAVVVGAAQQVVAADGVPRALSVFDAMTLAADRSEAVVSAQAALDRAQAQQTQAVSGWLPQASGTLSYRRTLASEYDALLATSSTSVPGGSPFAALPFGRPNTWNADLVLHESLLDAGGLYAGIRGAQAGVAARRVGVETARAQAVLAAVSAYDDALLADELLRIARETFAQAQATADRTRIAYEAGNAAEIEALRARVALENQRPQVLAQANASEVAHLRLKQILGLPLDQPLALSSALSASGDVARAAAGVLGVDARTAAARASVQQAEALVEARRAALWSAWSAHFPTFGLDMTYGVVAYPDNFFPKSDDLRNNWFVGGSLSIPLFTGFRTTAGVDAASADLRDAEAQLRTARDAADLDRRTVEQDIAEARAAYAATAGVIEDAQRALQIADVRYREGVGTFLDYNDARLQLEQAQANRSRAARNLQLALVEQALLPLLPVTSSSYAAASSAPSSSSLPSSSSSSSSAPAPASSGAGGSAPMSPGGGE